MLNFIFIFIVQAPAATLDEAFRSALVKNEVVAQSREKVVQAQERVNIAKAAPLPQLNVMATHLLQERPTDPLARAYFPDKQTTANFQLKQQIFNGFREFAALRQYKDLVEAGKQDRIAAMLALYESVATAYWGVIAQEHDLKNLREQSEIYGKRIKELQARGRRGESASYEALTAQSTEAALAADISLGVAKLREARENLHFLTGISPDATLEENEERGFALKPVEDYLRRLEERPDIKAAVERTQAASENLSFTKGSHWPRLEAVGNYYLLRPDGFLKTVDWDVQFTLTFPLYEGGMRMAETRQQSSAEREQTLELAKIRRKAESQIRTFHETLKLRQTQLEAMKKSADLSQKNYQAIQREFRRGLTRNVDVQVALTEYGVIRRTYDQARFAARLDRIKLESAAVILPASLEGSLQ